MARNPTQKSKTDLHRNIKNMPGTSLADIMADLKRIEETYEAEPAKHPVEVSWQHVQEARGWR